jgi:pyruvate dehydrogenase E2 component (dihydrolipoamide acetyltransferase)
VPVVFAAGAVQPRPVVEDDQVVVRQRMNVTVTIDHRFIDGHHLASILGTLRACLERPHENLGIPGSAEAASG